MENFDTATDVKDERVTSVLQAGDEGDDDGADPIRSLPRPIKPVQPDSKTRSDATDPDGDRRLRPRPSTTASPGGGAGPSNTRLPA